MIRIVPLFLILLLLAGCDSCPTRPVYYPPAPSDTCEVEDDQKDDDEEDDD